MQRQPTETQQNLANRLALRERGRTSLAQFLPNARSGPARDALEVAAVMLAIQHRQSVGRTNPYLGVAMQTLIETSSRRAGKDPVYAESISAITSAIGDLIAGAPSFYEQGPTGFTIGVLTAELQAVGSDFDGHTAYSKAVEPHRA